MRLMNIRLGAALLICAACESEALSERSRSGVPSSTAVADLSAADGERLCVWREELLGVVGLCRLLEAPGAQDEAECMALVADCVASGSAGGCESAKLRANLADCSPSVTIGRWEACDVEFAAWLDGLTCETDSWTDPPACLTEIADLCEPPAPACGGNCSCVCSAGRAIIGLIGGACTCNEACARTGNGSGVSGSCY
jgi:hypothetical protein